MRQVIVLEWKRKEGDNFYSKVEDGKGTALFHEWGCNYEEFENGAASYSTAIIERPDGTVESVSADLIKFVTPPPDTAGKAEE